MVIQNSRFLSVGLAAILLSFSAVAANERETYIPGKFEIERRAKALVDADEGLVDSALEDILKILDLKVRGSDHIRQAANCLQELLSIHETEDLGTNERKQQLAKLGARAKEFYSMPVNQSWDDQKDDLATLMNGQELDPIVRNFIKDYFNGLREYERITLQGSAAAVFGGSIGCGVGLLTYLSGDRCLALCPTLGWAVAPLTTENVPFGADATLECSRGTSNSCFTSSWRLHCAVFLGCVKNIRDVDSHYRDLRRYTFEVNQPCAGLGTGFSILEVNSGTVDIPVLPLPSSYRFARERLGITYPRQQGCPQKKPHDDACGFDNEGLIKAD